MRPFHVCHASLAALLIAVAASAARAEQSGDVTYAPPDGWTKQAAGPWTLWLPPADSVTPGKHVALYVFEGMAAGGELPAQLDATIAGQIGNAPRAAKSVEAPSTDTTGRQSVDGSATIQNDDGGRTIDVFHAYQVNGRFEVVFLSSDDAVNFQKQLGALGVIQKSARFPGEAAAPAAAIAKADPPPEPAAAEPAKRPLTIAPKQPIDRPLDGWICKTDTFNNNFFINVGWFRPDGRCYVGRHFGGSTDADFERLQKIDPANCGTYGVKNGYVEVQRNGEDHPTKFGGIARKLFWLGKGQRLDNTYSRSSSSANYGISGGYTAVAGATYHFHADGTFKGDEYAGVEGRNGSLGAGEKSDHGTYEINGPTITFTYSTGQTATFDIAGTDKPDKPDFIMLGGTDLMGSDY